MNLYYSSAVLTVGKLENKQNVQHNNTESIQGNPFKYKCNLTRLFEMKMKAFDGFH